jgi:hypothetical protein
MHTTAQTRWRQTLTAYACQATARTRCTSPLTPSRGARLGAQEPLKPLRRAKPIRPSKPAGRCNPTVGRFDSCAAPLPRRCMVDPSPELEILDRLVGSSRCSRRGMGVVRIECAARRVDETGRRSAEPSAYASRPPALDAFARSDCGDTRAAASGAAQAPNRTQTVLVVALPRFRGRLGSATAAPSASQIDSTRVDL